MGKPKAGPSRESRLIAHIFNAHGGTIAVAKKLKISKQLVSIWKFKGYVPLNRIMKVAAILKVPTICLNYRGLKDLVPSGNDWDLVKEECYKALRSI